MIQCIIFSKNRSLQLDLLIRSIKKYVKEYSSFSFKVLYLATSEVFEKGYEKLKIMYPDFIFIKETNFRNDLLGNIDTTKYLMFLTDDDVFKEEFTIESDEFTLFQEDKNITTLSLRLGRNITFCYSENIETPPPQSMTFLWKKLKGDWGYPASVDGNIFRTSELFPLIINMIFNNPNTFEASLSNLSCVFKDYMICFESSKLFNIPANRVQETFQNRSSNISIDVLNDYFLKDYKIHMEDIHNYKNKSCHEEFDIRVIKNG